MYTYPLLNAHTLAQYHYYLNTHDHLEFPHRSFVEVANVKSITLRAAVLRQLVERGDVVIGAAALWLHTGHYSPQLARDIPVARADECNRARAARRRLPQEHIEIVAGLASTSLRFTAVDYLCQHSTDATSALECTRAIEAALATGVTLSQLRSTAAGVHHLPGIRLARKVLRSLEQ